MKRLLILSALVLASLTASAQTGTFRIYMPADKAYGDSLRRGILSFDLPGYLSVQNIVSKKSWKSVATYAELLTVTPIPNTLLEIFVNADEKRGGGPTTYHLFPNGDRYLQNFLIVKDN